MHPITIANKLSHSHSDLTRLMDEVDAHIQGLADQKGCEIVLEGLREYFEQFSAGVRAHIHEEEQDLFPTLDQTTFSSTQIARLCRQHASMLQHLKDLETEIFNLHGPVIERHTSVDLHRSMAALRAEFVRHSADERAFLHDLNVRDQT